MTSRSIVRPPKTITVPRRHPPRVPSVRRTTTSHFESTRSCIRPGNERITRWTLSMPKTKSKGNRTPPKTKRLPKAANGNIELLLIQSVDHLGKQGDVVTVRPGYAMNYLLPQGL